MTLDTSCLVLKKTLAYRQSQFLASILCTHQKVASSYKQTTAMMKPYAVLVLLALAATGTFKWGTAHDNSYGHWMTIKDDSCPDYSTTVQENTAPIVRCKSGGGTGTLTRSCLRLMIDSVSHVFRNFTAPTTVLTSPDDGFFMYKSNKSGHAEQNFINKNQGQLNKFHSLWINNSPCAAICSKELVNAYQNISTPPVIYAAHFYVGKGTTKDQALMCLANMVTHKFSLKAFDWSNYSGYLDNNDCKQDIMTALNNGGFQDKMNQMTETVNLVYQYAQAGNTSCP